MSSSRGFTIIEVTITIFLIGTVVVGIFGLFILALRSAQDSSRRVVATALANERMEMVRNLPYLNVGTMGGVPNGSVPQSEVVVRSGLTYAVGTDIRYVDDPFDGESGGDTYSADYKQVRVEVSWENPNNTASVLFVTHIVPQGIEGGDLGGTLDFQVLDADGVGVASAEIHLVNDTVDPPIDLTTYANSDGELLLPGLTESADSYEISVTNSGFTSEQTYDVTPTFIPDADHSHLSMIIQTTTSKTFFIDNVASVNIHTQDDSLAALADIPYTFQGTKTIGVDDLGQPVYVVAEDATTSSNGNNGHADLVWDSYNMLIDGLATGYDIKETNLPLPLVVNPGDTIDLDVTLVPHTSLSLHVTVVDSMGDPIDNATVQLVNSSEAYDETLGTGAVGQVFFSDLPAIDDYDLNIDAPGFTSTMQTVPVDEGERIVVELATSS